MVSSDPRAQVNQPFKMTVSPHQAIFYPETDFGGFSDIDGTVVFYSRVNALIEASFQVVNFGCGRGVSAEDPVIFRKHLSSSLKGKVAKVIGLDIDRVGFKNRTVDEFRLLTADGVWPMEDNSADLVICDHVIEHLSDPASFFTEARRVLVKGGYICIRTPNALSYIGVVSRFIPNKQHQAILEIVQSGRKAEDIFPKLYRCNTVFALRRELRAHGFRAVVYGYEAEPSYLCFSKLVYAMGVLHQKFAPGFLRPAIFAFGQLAD